MVSAWHLMVKILGAEGSGWWQLIIPAITLAAVAVG